MILPNLPERNWKPDPNAPPCSLENPCHQSWLDEIHVGDRYKLSGNRVWAGTVLGSAGHLAQQDRYSGEPIKPASHYFHVARLTEESAGRVIAFHRDGSATQTKAQRAAFETGKSYEEFAALEKSRELGELLVNLSLLQIPGEVVGVEKRFIYQDEETGWWYEGTADLIVRLIDGTLVIFDWKFGGRNPADPADTGKPPAWRTSPQPHVYCLAALRGWWADAPDLPGVHQIDWTKAENWTRYEEWPSAFSFVHVRSLRRDDDSDTALDPESLNKAIMQVRPVLEWSEAYVRDLTRRWMDWKHADTRQPEPAAQGISLEDIL